MQIVRTLYALLSKSVAYKYSIEPIVNRLKLKIGCKILF